MPAVFNRKQPENIRGVDVNQRPLGYEPNELAVSI
jgi:hypothetical protein